MMKESSRKVFDFLKANYGTKLVARDIATALDTSIASVTACVNGLVKKGLAVRTEQTIAGPDEKEIVIKHISLTEAGLDYDPDAEVETK